MGERIKKDDAWGIGTCLTGILNSDNLLGRADACPSISSRSVKNFVPIHLIRISFLLDNRIVL